jgi:hypothetical protein
MFRFRSRSKERPGEGDGPPAAPEPTQAAFPVGERVEFTSHVQVFPEGSTGEVTSVSVEGGTISYEVVLDSSSNKNRVRVPGQHLKQVMHEPGVFEVGTRVRLTEQFEGHLWDKDLAAETRGPTGEPASYPRGTTGTVDYRHEGADEHMVKLDRSTMTLAVRSSKLERIPGCIRILPDGQGGHRIQQLFAYLDAVVLREEMVTEDGETRPAGSIGRINPINPHMSIVEQMEESWRTGTYTVRFELPSQSDSVAFRQIPAGYLQLQSDKV